MSKLILLSGLLVGFLVISFIPIIPAYVDLVVIYVPEGTLLPAIVIVCSDNPSGSCYQHTEDMFIGGGLPQQQHLAVLNGYNYHVVALLADDKTLSCSSSVSLSPPIQGYVYNEVVHPTFNVLCR